MTMGRTSTQVLTDIAIRYQAGVPTLYKPSEMAASITTLDGTNSGRYQVQGYPQLESGMHLRCHLHRHRRRHTRAERHE